MIGIIDYGAGNLRSVTKAFAFLDFNPRIVADPNDLKDLSGIVLPGVGAFGDGMRGLTSKGFVEPLLERVAKGVPFLGICLGLQFLFESSEESPGIPGLSLLKGKVKRFKGGYKIPHMGWNQVQFSGVDCLPIESKIDSNYFYFVHSYYAKPDETEIIWGETDYHGSFTSAVKKENILAVQFHPEKSQNLGLELLKEWGNLC